MLNSTIAQRARRLGVSLENAEEIVVEQTELPVDPAATELADPTAIYQAQSEVDEADSVLEQLQSDHGELSEVAAALESFLAMPGDHSPALLHALAIPVRRATKPYGLSNSIPSMESVAGGPEAVRAGLRASLEATEGRIAQLVKWIKEVFKAMLEKALEMWKQFTDYITRQGDMARSLLGAMSAGGSYAWMLVVTERDTTVSDITIPASSVAALSLKGSYAGDVPEAYKSVQDLVEAQLLKITPTVLDVHADNIMTVEEIIRDAATLKDDDQAGVDSLLEKFGALMENLSTKMKTEMERSARVMEGAEVENGVLRTREYLGGVRFAFDLSNEGANIAVSIDQQPVQNEELTTRPLTPTQIESGCKSIVEVCETIFSYQKNNGTRKKMFADVERLIKTLESTKVESQVVEQSTKQIITALSVSLRTAMAFERPLINYVAKVNREVLRVINLSIQGYKRTGKERAALPAPAKD